MDSAEIDQKLRLGKADALLLYIASFQTVILTLSQVYLGSWTLAYYPPIFFLVAVMPIYVGYVRGAITVNTIVERTRGWLYLIFGTILYLIVVTVWILGQVSDVIGVLQTAAFTLLAFSLPIVVPVSGKRILEALGGSADRAAMESFAQTSWGIMWMSLVLGMIAADINGVMFLMNTTVGASWITLFVSAGVIGTLVSEKMARQSAKGTYVKEKPQVRNRRSLWIGILGLALFVLATTLLRIVGLTSLLLAAILVGLMGLGIALIFLSVLWSWRSSRKESIDSVRDRESEH